MLNRREFNAILNGMETTSNNIQRKRQLFNYPNPDEMVPSHPLKAIGTHSPQKSVAHKRLQTTTWMENGNWRRMGGNSDQHSTEETSKLYVYSLKQEKHGPSQERKRKRCWTIIPTKGQWKELLPPSGNSSPKRKDNNKNEPITEIIFPVALWTFPIPESLPAQEIISLSFTQANTTCINTSSTTSVSQTDTSSNSKKVK